MNGFLGFIIILLIIRIIYRANKKKKRDIEITQLEKRKVELETKIKDLENETVDSFDFVVTGSQFESNATGIKRENYIKKLTKNDELFLIPEPENEYDEFALLVVNNENIDIGYVPKPNNRLIIDHIINDKKAYSCYLKKTYEKGEYINAVVIIELYE